MVGALLVKELRSAGRRPRTFAFRLACAGLAAWALYDFVDAAGRLGGLSGVSEFAQLGRRLFAATVLLQAVAAALGAAAFAADGLVRESARGTMPLLVLSGLSVRQIVAAKWAAASAQSAALLLCGAPALAMAAFLGAVSPVEVLAAVVVAVSAGGASAALGVHASARSETPAAALGASLAGLALFLIIPLIGTFMTVGYLGLLLVFVHPAFAMAALLGAGAALSPAALGVGCLTLPAATAGFVALVLRGAERRLARRLLTVPALPNAPRDLVGLEGLYARKRKGVWDDAPLVWKDLTTRAAARIPLLGRIFVLVTLAAFILMGLFYLHHSAWPYFVFLGFFYSVLALAAGTTALSGEGGRWDLIRVTPMARSRILGSKLLAALIAPEMVVIAALYVLSCAIWGALNGPAFFLVQLGVSALFLLLCFLTGAAWGLAAPNLGAAFAGAAASVGILLAAPPYLGGGWSALNPVFLLEEVYERVRAGRGLPLDGLLANGGAALAACAGLLAFMLLKLSAPRRA